MTTTSVGLAVEADVADDRERREIDGGNRLPFFVRNERIARKPGAALLPAAGERGSGQRVVLGGRSRFQCSPAHRINIASP